MKTFCRLYWFAALIFLFLVFGGVIYEQIIIEIITIIFGLGSLPMFLTEDNNVKSEYKEPETYIIYVKDGVKDR